MQLGFQVVGRNNRIAVAALLALPMARHTTLGGHPGHAEIEEVLIFGHQDQALLAGAHGWSSETAPSAAVVNSRWPAYTAAALRRKSETVSLPRFQGQCLESCFYTDPMKTNDHNEFPFYATPLQR